MNKLFEKYKEMMFKISSYELALRTASLDAQVIAPSKGSNYRNERLSYLEGELYSLQTDEEFFKLINELINCEELDEQNKSILKWQLKDLKKKRCLPKQFCIDFSKLQMESQQNWEKAKQNNDYKIFEPYLREIIAKTKEIIKYRQNELSGYDILLDDYEPGMDQNKYDVFFVQIKEKIVPLIHKISQTKQIDDSFIFNKYPIEQQKELMNKILNYIGFDFDAGVLMESEHPFTDSLSKYDTRITTHYYENNLISSIYSVIHEAGHANYYYSIRDDIATTYCYDNMSSGMHESQSRLFENYLGRNYHFWDSLFPQMKQLFPEQLKSIEQIDFVRAANKSIPSLIRTEADELTYPLHILIRYEIEKGLFNDSIDPKNLEEIWNAKYKEYLGLTVENASDGILQDVHWSDGSFGYFPTYALGSSYAAQFMHYLNKDVNVDECLANNQFYVIKDWLAQHIHQYGGLYLPEKQIEIACGEKFNPQYYIDYLLQKYSQLYNL